MCNRDVTTVIPSTPASLLHSYAGIGKQSVTRSKEEQQYPGVAFSRILPRRIRWVAAAAGCVRGTALLGLSWVVLPQLEMEKAFVR